jgi:hypothetical protein
MAMPQGKIAIIESFDAEQVVHRVFFIAAGAGPGKQLSQQSRLATSPQELHPHNRIMIMSPLRRKAAIFPTNNNSAD